MKKERSQFAEQGRPEKRDGVICIEGWLYQ